MHSSPAPSPEIPAWLVPAWRRLGVITLLAACAFCLPQEAPLEWYPLNEPGSDILYLEVSCAASQPGEARLFYDTAHGFNALESVRWPMTASIASYTYTFPLPDAPLIAFQLQPLAAGGALTVRQLRIIDRRGTEVRRFARDDFVPLRGIAGIVPVTDGWKIVSEAGAQSPAVRLQLAAPIVAARGNHRNFLRCLYSWSYLALMICILLLAVLFTFFRPRSWRELAAPLFFMGAISLLFSGVGNRGLIKNSLRSARFAPPVVAPTHQLEIYLSIDHPQTAQLFWDRGAGFNEADSVRLDYEREAGSQTLRFPLPAGPLRALRFDPLDGDARLVVHEIRLIDAAERILTILPLDSLESGQDIDQRVLSGNALTVQTRPGARDPILQFSPAAVSMINATLPTGR
ncbi:MAG: hypothetical protein JWM35_368 [Verrucomicrobia bacterium]|nr:hypothetical protein [Verrucomicrobiota bacterium]